MSHLNLEKGTPNPESALNTSLAALHEIITRKESSDTDVIQATSMIRDIAGQIAYQKREEEERKRYAEIVAAGPPDASPFGPGPSVTAMLDEFRMTLEEFRGRLGTIEKNTFDILGSTPRPDTLD